jgi:Ca2+-binding RTX toxin-like protein
MATIFETGEAPSDITTPYTLNYGDSFVGSLTDDRDEDWLRFIIPEDGYDYLLRMTSEIPGADRFVLELFFGDDTGFERTGSQGDPAEVYWVSGREPGEHYVSMRAYSNEGFFGGYTVETLRETGSGMTTAATITANTTITGQVDYANDRDWYQMSAQADRAYIMVLTPNGNYTGEAGISGAFINDRNRVASGSTQYDDGMVVVSYWPSVDETVWATTYGTDILGYSLQLIEEDPANSQTTLALTVGEAFLGALEYRDDRDLIRVELQRGRHYEVAVEGLGMLPDTDLQIDASRGDVSLFYGDSRFDEDHRALTLNVNTDGFAYLIVESDNPMDVGEYQVTVTVRDETLTGDSRNNTLTGYEGNDTLYGMNGSDTLIGGAGDDLIFGGETSADLRDVIYGGAGNDSIHGGYGNDELRGDAGNDSIEGGFGVDTVIGGSGDDTLTGSAYGDEIFGGDGLDFINGGFGHDRLNGGADGDRFYHIGVFDHGSDWIQDYNAAQGDVLMWGGAAATADDFQVNTADTPDAGVAGVSESFIIYRPTSQIMWALVDGDAQSSINIQIGGQTFDLLA